MPFKSGQIVQWNGPGPRKPLRVQILDRYVLEQDDIRRQCKVVEVLDVPSLYALGDILLLQESELSAIQEGLPRYEREILL